MPFHLRACLLLVLSHFWLSFSQMELLSKQDTMDRTDKLAYATITDEAKEMVGVRRIPRPTITPPEWLLSLNLKLPTIQKCYFKKLVISCLRLQVSFGIPNTGGRPSSILLLLIAL